MSREGDDLDGGAEDDGLGDEPDERQDEELSDEFLREIARVDDVPPPSTQPWVGTRIAHFRLLDELGRGGMGIVYLAQDEKLRRSVALKVLPPSLTRHEERRRRFLREARAAASVSHPNLATIYDVGEVDGRVYIAMERVDGRSLRQLLAGTQLSLDDVLDIAGQILAGLAKAHDRGVVHRDLKPDNVMVTDEGVCKLLDFGLAKQERGEEALSDAETVESDTAAGHVIGTPGYMSPEQARGRTVDARSDIFSFGVILYEMLTGRRPFTGQTRADLVTAILRDTPEPVSAHRPDAPAAVERVVERCLEKDPAARFQDCGTIAAELGRPEAHKPRRFATTGSSPTIRGTAASVGTPSGARASSRPARRWPVVAAITAAAALAAGVWVNRWGRTAPAAAPTSAPASTSAGPRPTAVTELPPPASRSPEALAAFATAMQGFRDGNWGYVEESLAKALQLDPSMAAAHLRMAVTLEQARTVREAGASWAQALLGRATLSERDQVLLSAYEPVLGRDPPDRAEWVARLQAATQRYPGDAELFVLLAYADWSHPQAALGAAQRSAELDPQYADAWQAVGKYHFALGDSKASLAALDRCIALSPATADCRGERGWIHSSEGRCEAMEADFRRAVASSKGGLWSDGRAAALFALGRPPEAVLEALRRKWAQLAEPDRRRIEPEDLFRLDFATGHFDKAEEHLLEAIRATDANSDVKVHASQAHRLIGLYLETGRVKDAGRAADDYLKRHAAWRGADEADGSTLPMLRVMLQAQMLSRTEFEAKRDAWLRLRERTKTPDEMSFWPVVTAGARVETEEDARQVLAAMPDIGPPPCTSKSTFALGTFGKLYVLAGRHTEALPLLRRVVNGCEALESPLDHMRSAYYLGRALEGTGDVAGACAAYSIVLGRWGDARPPSVTASKARERGRALGCPSDAGPARKPVTGDAASHGEPTGGVGVGDDDDDGSGGGG